MRAARLLVILLLIGWLNQSSLAFSQTPEEKRALIESLAKPLAEDVVMYRWQSKAAADDLLRRGYQGNVHDAFMAAPVDRTKASAGNGLYVASNPLSSSHYARDYAEAALVEVRVPKGTLLLDVSDDATFREMFARGIRAEDVFVGEPHPRIAVKYNKEGWWVLKTPTGVRINPFHGDSLTVQEIKDLFQKMIAPTAKKFFLNAVRPRLEREVAAKSDLRTDLVVREMLGMETPRPGSMAAAAPTPASLYAQRLANTDFSSFTDARSLMEALALPARHRDAEAKALSVRIGENAAVISRLPMSASQRAELKALTVYDEEAYRKLMTKLLERVTSKQDLLELLKLPEAGDSFRTGAAHAKFVEDHVERIFGMGLNPAEVRAVRDAVFLNPDYVASFLRKALPRMKDSESLVALLDHPEYRSRRQLNEAVTSVLAEAKVKLPSGQTSEAIENSARNLTMPAPAQAPVREVVPTAMPVAKSQPAPSVCGGSFRRLFSRLSGSGGR